ncbi:PAS domain S-box protein [Labrenzia sp. R4_1]|uniref:PAS domain-containing sensor histidine kinase n=1 Tax=Labrenzia sp. R4_1 TaxID=2821106 RepID=UPI001ADC091D|nr:PAS domain S-box protein [Labrenzia sp. R4_1]MBO9424896.1 PAS domain S-box protein [Labrenzia sp. R4_1]
MQPDLEPSEHYLETEFFTRIQSDPEIINFLEEGSLDGLWYWDLEYPEHEWLSPRFKTLFGYEQTEIPHTSAWWQENILPEDLQKALHAFQAHESNPTIPYDVEVRYRHKDGHLIWVRCRGKIIRDKAGKPIRMIGAHTDITALKSRETQLDYLNSVQKTLLDTVQHGLLMFEAIRNGEGRIIDLEMIEANSAACKLVDRSRDSLIGRYLSETFPGNFEDGLFEAYRDALNSGQPVKLTRHYQHDGLDNWYDIVATPHSSDLLVISFNDITAFKLVERELEQEKKKFEELYFRTPAIMHSINGKGELVQVSDAWCDMFGYGRHEAHGMRSTDVLTDESIDYARDVVLPAFWRDGRCDRVPYTFKRQDGSTFEGELSAVAFGRADQAREDQVSFAVIEEVSERNQSRRELEHTIDTLRDVKTRLEKFSHAASHDLKEPLRKIETFLPMLLKARDEDDAQTAAYANQVIDRALGRANALITALLNFSKSQDRTLETTSVDLSEALDQAWQSVSYGGTTEAPVFRNEAESIKLTCDPVLFDILLVNLFSNAAKYRSKDRQSHIGAWTGTDETGRTCLHIEDNGIGLDKDELQKIFDPFIRLHTQMEFPGSGIGLATCATVCKRHGWSISADGNPGQGSCFSIRFDSEPSATTSPISPGVSP